MDCRCKIKTSDKWPNIYWIPDSKIYLFCLSNSEKEIAVLQLLNKWFMKLQQDKKEIHRIEAWQAQE